MSLASTLAAFGPAYRVTKNGVVQQQGPHPSALRRAEEAKRAAAWGPSNPRPLSISDGSEVREIERALSVLECAHPHFDAAGPRALAAWNAAYRAASLWIAPEGCDQEDVEAAISANDLLVADSSISLAKKDGLYGVVGPIAQCLYDAGRGFCGFMLRLGAIEALQTLQGGK